MASLIDILPAPKHKVIVHDADKPLFDFSKKEERLPSPKRFVEIPSYGKRGKWLPEFLEDYADGGAYPECLVLQYPLDMGNKKKGSNQLALVTDGSGSARHDAAILRQGQRPDKLIVSKLSDSLARDATSTELQRPGQEAEEETAKKTREALEKIVNVKIAAAHTPIPAAPNTAPTYIRYTPATQNSNFNSGSKQRLIRMVEVQSDPLSPPRFKHKKLPRGPGSPPVPVMHSPPRKLTVQDIQNWKVPPCVSNWKNPKGYIVPLDKRLAADGRGLQETVVNENFSKLADALFIAERAAREEVEKRAAIQKKLAQKEKDAREEELRKLAQKTRAERAGIPRPDTEMSTAPSEREPTEYKTSSSSRRLDTDTYRRDTDMRRDTDQRMPRPDTEDIERARRDEIREERRHERERDRRQEARKGRGVDKEAERDISEKIALGQAAPTMNEESLYDTRLFNQSAGMSSGFAADDAYSVYDRAMFTGSKANAPHRARRTEEDKFGGEEAFDKIVKSADKFRGEGEKEESSSKRDSRMKPVEFEKDQEEDPFGLGEFLTEAKKGGGKRALDKIGSSGFMAASAGGANSRDVDSYRESKRSRLDFEKSSR